MSTFTRVCMWRAVFVFAFLFFYGMATAQNGQYDVRFLMFDYDCDTEQIFLDVQVSATSPATEFLMSNQNYRISFNRDAAEPINPGIQWPESNPIDRTIYVQEELETSGFTFVENSASFFSPHTLIGSLDTISSYNVIMSAGTGYPVHADEWVSVGRLRFQILDPSQELNIKWRTHDPLDFPPTFIGEIGVGGFEYPVAEGNYEDFTLTLSSLCGFTLPIELSYFNGVDLGCEIELLWETRSESNNAYFDLEKSTDGENFQAIARIEGAGNSESINQYRYLDKEVMEINYYRLRQVDFDGTSSFSDRISIKPSCFDQDLENGITGIYPNPVNDQVTSVHFYLNGNDQSAKLEVYDVLGSLALEIPVELIPGANKITFDPTSLPPGTYTVKFSGTEWFSKAQKLIVVR